MTDQVDPNISLLLGKCHLRSGELIEAELLFDAAEAAIQFMETDHSLRQRAGLETLRAELANVRGDKAAEQLHRQKAFSLLCRAGRLFPWDSGYRHGLAEDIHTAAERLVPLLKAAGDEGRANDVLEQVDLADRARELEFAPLPEEPDEFTQLLIDYRTTMRHLCNLRRVSYRLLNSDDEPGWNVYLERRDLDWKYRGEIIRQFAQLKQDVLKRIESLEREAAKLTSQMYVADPEKAAVVFLLPLPADIRL